MILPTKMIKNKTETKKKIVEFIEKKTFDTISELRSPVTGQRFKDLSKKYAERKAKRGLPVPNLELTGNMLKSYDSKITSRSIELGIFDGKDALKADNHNKFSAKSEKTPVPARKFIPNKKKGERYPNSILNGIADIIKSDSGESKSSIVSALKELN